MPNDHVARYALIALINHLIIKGVISYPELRQHFSNEADDFEKNFGSQKNETQRLLVEMVAELRAFLPDVPAPGALRVIDGGKKDEDS